MLVISIQVYTSNFTATEYNKSKNYEKHNYNETNE